MKKSAIICNYLQISQFICNYVQLCEIIFNYLQLRFCLCDLGHIAPLSESPFCLFLTHQPTGIRLKLALGLSSTACCSRHRGRESRITSEEIDRTCAAYWQTMQQASRLQPAQSPLRRFVGDSEADSSVQLRDLCTHTSIPIDPRCPSPAQCCEERSSERLQPVDSTRRILGPHRASSEYLLFYFKAENENYRILRPCLVEWQFHWQDAGAVGYDITA